MTTPTKPSSRPRRIDAAEGSATGFNGTTVLSRWWLPVGLA